MATYPGGVFAPAAKATGNTIQAAHVNDLDNEVVAIEDALRNGIVHAVTISTGGLTVSTGGLRVGGPSTVQALTAGASTLASLSVTGGSTIGTLSAGNSTVADLNVTGTLTLPGGAVVGGRLPSAKVSIAASSVALSSGAFAGISWTTDDYDSTNLHSTASNSSRVALTSSGIWSFGGQILLDIVPPSSVVMAGRVLANDADVIAAHQALVVTASTLVYALPLAGTYYATDTTAYLTCQARWIGNGGLSISGSTGTGFGPTHFWVTKVSA